MVVATIMAAPCFQRRLRASNSADMLVQPASGHTIATRKMGGR